MSDNLLNMPGIPTIGQTGKDPYQGFLEDTGCRATMMINWFHDGSLEYSVHADNRVYPDGNITAKDFIGMLEKAANTLLDSLEADVKGDDDGEDTDAS